MKLIIEGSPKEIAALVLISMPMVRRRETGRKVNVAKAMHARIRIAALQKTDSSD